MVIDERGPVSVVARPRSASSAPNGPEVATTFQAVPETMIAEILDGELRAMPRSRPRHARAATRLARQLDDDPDPSGGWVLFIGPELHLGPKPDKIVPDIAGGKRERLVAGQCPHVSSR